MLAATMRRFDDAERWLARSQASCEQPLLSLALRLLRLEQARLAVLRAAPGDHAAARAALVQIEREFDAQSMPCMAALAVRMRERL